MAKRPRDQEVLCRNSNMLLATTEKNGGAERMLETVEKWVALKETRACNA